MSRVEIDGPVRATAAAYTDDQLQSLDAIRLATADTLVAAGRNIKAFVSYDIRQSRAAAAAGFPIVAPGRT